RGDLDDLECELAVGRTLEHTPGRRAAPRAVPDQFDGHAGARELGGAPVPDRHHVDLAVADELLGLVAFPPPNFDVRLDLVELFESAVDVDRIDFVVRHAVGDQGEYERALGIAEPKAAWTREFFDVPEVGPSGRAAVGEFVAPVTQIGALAVAGDAEAVGDDRVRRERAPLHDGPVNRLGQALAARAQPLRRADRGHVELIAA